MNQDDLDQIRQCMISKKTLVMVDDVGKTKNLTSLYNFSLIQKMELLKKSTCELSKLANSKISCK